MKLSVKTVGSGPNLVLLHGWGMNSSIWNGVLPSLQRRYQVTCVDLPGHGQSVCDAGWTMDAFVDECSELVPINSIVLGWSLGGMLALRLAHRHPRCVRKLILVASSAKFVRSKDWLSAQPKAVLSMFAGSLMDKPQATIKRFLLLQTQGTKNQVELNRLLKELMTDDGLPQLAGLECGLNILKTSDLRDDLSRLSCPILQILGGKDQLVPVAVASASMGLNPAMQSVIIDDAAHIPFISHPSETLSAIDGFCLA